MLKLGRLGQQAAIVMGTIALIVFGYFLRDAVFTRSLTCGQSLDNPCPTPVPEKRIVDPAPL